METENTPSVVVAGYAFRNVDDAALAEQERKKIEYLRAHLDTNRPETVLALYNKAIADRLFKTPVGTEFLRDLRQYLVEQADYPEEEIQPVQLYLTYDTQALRDNVARTRERVSPPKEEKPRISPLFVSVVLNIALAAAVCAMFWIAMKTDHPNILNYERTLQDLYAEWDQRLTEREQAVRERERELSMGSGSEIGIEDSGSAAE